MLAPSRVARVPARPVCLRRCALRPWRCGRPWSAQAWTAARSVCTTRWPPWDFHGAEGALAGVAPDSFGARGWPAQSRPRDHGRPGDGSSTPPQRLLAARASPSASSSQDARWSSSRLQDDHSRLAVTWLGASSETSQATWSAWCFSDWGSFSSRESIG